MLKASEDKTFPGAIVASLASPWGQAVPAGVDRRNSEPAYFGSYREVFARDLYEAFTGLLADGDMQTARAATLFLFDRQQLRERGDAAQLAAQRQGRPRHRRHPAGRDRLPDPDGPPGRAWAATPPCRQNHIRPAADFLVANGPSFGVERWEEQTGYSPSTIAAEIAGLTAASVIAKTTATRPGPSCTRPPPTTSSA